MDIEKRIRQYLHAYDNGQVDLNEESLAALIRAAVAEVTPPKGHVLTDDGKVRKVLGTLPLTADGCVVGEDAVCWRDKSRSLTGEVRQDSLVLCWGVYEMGNGIRTSAASWYSTREAAEAASKEAK